MTRRFLLHVLAAWIKFAILVGIYVKFGLVGVIAWLAALFVYHYLKYRLVSYRGLRAARKRRTQYQAEQEERRLEKIRTDYFDALLDDLDRPR